MKRNQILAALLAAMFLLIVPAGAGALPAKDYEARITAVKDGIFFSFYDTITSGAYTVTGTFDEAGYLLNAAVKYGESVVYDAQASQVTVFPNSLYLYNKGVLKLFENGKVKTVLTVDEEWACAGISDDGGDVFAYFMDSPRRDFYAYNITNGTSAMANIGSLSLEYYALVHHGVEEDVVYRSDGYISLLRRDVSTGEFSNTLLKHEGETLTIVEPDRSSVPNANPGGGKLSLFYTDYAGYYTESGEVAAFYDYATQFFYNEDGAGVAFVIDDGLGYFVDQYLNVVSRPIEAFGASCSEDGVFVIYVDALLTQIKSYYVELVPRGTAGADLFGIMRPLASRYVW